ncbi:MAG: CPBP family intramembrane glutamic endopeptidase [Bacteroidia bacterium]
MDNLPQERHSWIKLGVILSLLFGYGIATVLASSGGPELNLDDVNMKPLLYFGQIVGVVILFIAPAFLFAGLWTKARIGYLGITTKPALSTLLIASLGILAAFPLINWLAGMNEQMHLPASMHGIEEWMKRSEEQAGKLTDVFTRGTSVGGLILNLFVVAFMAAFSEELFFRGILQKVLHECFKNKHVAVWLGAAFFSAFHMQFYGFIPRMLMGAYLGYLFLWSGSIWPGMMAHFVNNGIAVFIVWLTNRGAVSADVDKIGSESSQFVYVVCSALMVALSMIVIRRIEKKRRALI